MCVVFRSKVPPHLTHTPLQLQLIQQNPQLAQAMLGSDPRMIDVLGALMGIDMQGFSRPEGSDEVPPGVPGSAGSPPSSPPLSARPPPSAAPASASSSKIHEPEDVKMAEAEEAEAEEDEDAAVKAAAAAEKKLGADAYKKRDFATAITHFSKAWETWPKDVTFLTNLAGGECWFLFALVTADVRACIGFVLAQRHTLSKATTTSRSKRVKRPWTRAVR